MHLYPKNHKQKVMGCGCGHNYEMKGEGIIGDLFKGLVSAGKKVFSKLKLKELAATTGKSLLEAGKKSLVEDVVPALKKSAITLGTSAVERGTNEIVARIENKPAPVMRKSLIQETQDISAEELEKLRQRVKQIALEETQKAKNRAISNIQSLGAVEQQYEEIMDPISQNGGALLRLGEKRPKKRGRGRPRGRN